LDDRGFVIGIERQILGGAAPDAGRTRRVVVVEIELGSQIPRLPAGRALLDSRAAAAPARLLASPEHLRQGVLPRQGKSRGIGGCRALIPTRTIDLVELDHCAAHCNLPTLRRGFWLYTPVAPHQIKAAIALRHNGAGCLNNSRRRGLPPGPRGIAVIALIYSTNGRELFWLRGKQLSEA
jgi:hypothetical protein